MEKLTIEKFKEKINNNDYNFSNFDIWYEIQSSLNLLNDKEVKFYNSKISGLKFENISFKNLTFEKTEFNWVSFEGNDFSNSTFNEIKFIGIEDMSYSEGNEYNFYTIFKKNNFKNIEFKKTTFENIKFKDCDFSNSKFLDETKFKNCDLSENTFNRLSTDNISFNYLFWECKLKWSYFYDTDIINEFNSEDLKEKWIIYDNLEQQKKILEQQIKTLQKISDARFWKLSESFEKLEKKFKKEEIIWISISFILFISMLYFFAIPIFDMLLFSKIYYFIFYWILWFFWIIIFSVFIILENFEKIDLEKENINIIEKIKIFFKKECYSILKFILFSIFLSLFFFNFNSFLSELKAPEKSLLNFSYYYFIPFWIVLTTFLYFSVTQYSTSKKLRIENQNKVALLHWMVWIKADTDKDMDKNIFYQNVANIVFSKVYEWKEENLPLDKVLELVKIINSNNKK